jgi:hypothetical protein
MYEASLDPSAGRLGWGIAAFLGGVLLLGTTVGIFLLTVWGDRRSK